jgi:phosphatidate cytidylyltransferase
MGSLIQRLLTAAVAIPILLGATFCKAEPTLQSINWPFQVLATVMLGIALLEFFGMLETAKIRPLKVMGLLILIAVIGDLVFLTSRPGYYLRLGMLPPDQSGLLVVCGLFLVTVGFLGSERPLEEAVTCISTTFFGAFYFGALGSYFFLILYRQGPWMLFLLYLSTWAFDTGAYIAGNLWGKHKVAPAVSPNKTWEGCLGGLLLCFAILYLLWKIIPAYRSIPFALGLGDIVVLTFLLSTVGQFGDLIESMIKRSLRVKDSGKLIPGHGGVFDRIDSLLFNAPVLYYYVEHFGRAFVK